MSSVTITLAKALIAMLFVALLAIQFWVVPELAHGMAHLAPEFAHLEIPGIVLVGLLIVCVEAILVCLWRLLTMVARREIFAGRAFAWVDAIIVAIAAAVALVVIGSGMISTAQAGSPITLILAVLAVIGGTCAAMVVAVMRSLLHRATALEREMAEVV